MTCASVSLVAGAALLTAAPALAAESYVTEDGTARITVDAEGDFTIVASPAAPSSRAGEIVCTGAFRNRKPYDHPHAGHSSDRKKVNAHLSIKCTGPGAGATVVTLTSRMSDGRRIGKASTKTGRGGARVGGDLVCLKQKRTYQALGTISIKFPPRYTPPAASRTVKSPSKPFKQGKKKLCVKP
ncbi:hypothetical protein LO762_15380 [Actinocorallia sp. API 0066]|uniref:hypothetical protein n=1 Tax=Actinocorallia sp. API 0066 TaxID=2896846 RepID=UPI001E622EA3|nr:hypothetical protein [Actinocorallia sp. API 0066]MCD0450561.1 hypothetical protein [Actinocorallia sp. API 0066]